MLETWLSKDRLLSNSTPRFLTDDEESREQPSSVRQCSRLLLLWFLGPIINTLFFQNLVVRNYSPSSFYIDYAFHKFLNLVCFTGLWRDIELKQLHPRLTQALRSREIDAAICGPHKPAAVRSPCKGSIRQGACRQFLNTSLETEHHFAQTNWITLTVMHYQASYMPPN